MRQEEKEAHPDEMEDYVENDDEHRILIEALGRLRALITQSAFTMIDACELVHYETHCPLTNLGYPACDSCMDTPSAPCCCAYAKNARCLSPWIIRSAGFFWICVFHMMYSM